MIDLRQGSDGSSGKREACQICYKEGHVGSNCRKLLRTSQPVNNLTGQGTEILICQICKKRGHGADKCWFHDPQSYQSVTMRQERTICQLCSKSGHDAKSCQNNINNKINKVICQWCEKSGHSANNCWRKQNEQRYTENNTRVTCQICNNFGHTAKDCRSKIHQIESRNALFCRYCKEQGHVFEDCQTLASNNRRKKDNQGNLNSLSTSNITETQVNFIPAYVSEN